VVSKLIGRHWRYEVIPMEVRFHVEDVGFPGLLAGSTSKEDFIRRMRGFWWRGFRTRAFRGLYSVVEREDFDRALDAFDAGFDADPEGACRKLFLDLLWPRVEASGATGLVEQSCDTIAAAPVLARLFPEARFVHIVRDGRDASASRVAQARWLVYPRTRRQGLEWWERRIRQMDRGARELPPERLLTVSLDELLLLRHRALRPLASFIGIAPLAPMRRFFGGRMTAERGNVDRWRRGLSVRRAGAIEQRYAKIVAGLEADGVQAAPLLRRTLERSQGADLPPLAYVAGDGALIGAAA
jgi:hypothetical protein